MLAADIVPRGDLTGDTRGSDSHRLGETEVRLAVVSTATENCP